MSEKKYTAADGGPVGFKRPPVQTQFKEGHKPKGAGRPKGSKNLHVIVKESGESRVSVRIGGKVRSVSSLEAAVARIRQLALTGTGKDVERFLDLVERYPPNRADPEWYFKGVQWIPGDEGY